MEIPLNDGNILDTSKKSDIVALVMEKQAELHAFCKENNIPCMLAAYLDGKTLLSPNFCLQMQNNYNFIQAFNVALAQATPGPICLQLKEIEKILIDN